MVRLPPLASIIITNRCNLNCTHCYTNANALKFQELGTDTWKSVIDDLAALPVFQLYIGGGEPALRHDFVELLCHAVGLGLTVTTSTNGRFISDEVAARIPRDVFLQVSIDGPRALHDRMRGAGSYDLATKAVGILKRYDHNVSVATVVTKLNWRFIRGFYRTTIRELNPSLWHILRLQPVGRGLENYGSLGLSNQEWLEVVKWLRKLRASGFPIGIDSSFDLEGVEDLHKEDAWFYWRDHGVDICIWPNGDTTPSDLCLPPFWTIGNVLTARGVEALRRMIMSSEILARLNEAQMSVGGKCLGCKAYHGCRGGSRIVALTLTGDLRAPDPFCPHDPPKYAY